MATLLIRNARYIVSCDDKDTLWEHANLFIRDNAIEYIGERRMQADQCIDASDMILYPGLISAHHHLYQLFSRGLPEAGYGVWRHLDGESLYWSSLTGMGELLKNGCTTCFDHHCIFPAGAGDLLANQFRAAALAGIRFHASRGSMDRAGRDGGLPPDSLVQSMDEILADSQRLVKVWHDESRFSMRQVALAPCSPVLASADLMRESAALARSLGVRLHTHIDGAVDAERLGMRPAAYLAALGWTGTDVWYANGTHLDDSDLRLLAETGTGVAYCPVANMKRASGVCRVPELLRLGIPAGLGAEGPNLLEELRVGYLLQRLAAGERAPDGYRLLKLATRGSAQLLGRDDLGALAPNMAADLFAISLDKLALVGAGFDPKGLLCTVGYRGPVDYTIVNGVAVVQKGELTTFDEAQAAARANQAARRYLRR